MSLNDLRRLIQRATPRVEDVRSPDRTDFIRRDHKHLILREVVDALDALEFSAVAFPERMRALQARKVAEAAQAPEPEVHTAVHGLFHALDGLTFLTPNLAEPSAASLVADCSADEALEGEPTAEQAEVAAEARKRGGERFKAKDFDAAIEEYTAAIRGTSRSSSDLHALYSNRSAALLQLGGREIVSALADARRCMRLAPEWPKGHFREGCCLRALGFYAEAARAFQTGQALEPDNKDWDREIERTDQMRRSTPQSLARQLVFALLPELLAAWARGGDREGVLQVQANGEFSELGVPKWQLVKERQTPPRVQLRYAFLRRKDYLANLAANLQSPPAEGAAVVDINGEPLRIPEICDFLPAVGSDRAAIHLDVSKGASTGKMIAILLRVPCDGQVVPYLGALKEPPPPKGAVDGVLQLQRSSGFPKALPRLIGFQSFPGDLNFPVIDLDRDAPEVC